MVKSNMNGMGDRDRDVSKGGSRACGLGVSCVVMRGRVVCSCEGVGRRGVGGVSRSLG